MAHSDLDQLAIDTIRGLSMDAVQAANSGHPGTPMALAPLGWLLFHELRAHDPKAPEWAGRDRFVLSCGHASMLQYALLHLSGYDLSLDDLKAFRQWDSKTPGHPEVFHTAGVETTTGPLGQGIGNAVGMAMAARYLGKRFDEGLFDTTVWTIASDGDLMEGVASEAASLAGHLKLGQLVVFYDDNSITIDGRTDLAFSEDVNARFAAYGWHTLDVADGNDLEALRAAAKAAKADPRPSLVRVKTIIGWPAPNKQDTPAAHGAPLGADEVKATKEAMGWPLEPFHVPAEMATLREEIVARGKAAREAWEAKKAEWAKAHPAEAAELDAALAGGLPAGWEEKLPRFEADAKGMATRAASGKVIAALGEAVPTLVGGSADLTGSNKTQIAGGDFRAESEGVPRYVYWGVREHGMGSAMNGMALYGGNVPFGATFLVFADYMRPALRLAALMGLKTRYVFTHDSIGLGEDGPTHQPVETLASLRAIPGFTVLRPADANETREAWIAAMRCEGPAALVLTRQNVETLDRDGAFASAEGVHRGAYVLKDVEGAQVVLVGTGSEVGLALEAAETLAEKGVKARVVSMPSWELFEAQDEAYRAEVFPKGLPRVVVEAGIRQGWDRWIGEGGFVTLDRFGASAPYETLYEKLGITAEAVVAEALRLVG
ncbi:MAG TPA: transketolase [Polyangiaceae bacterium LLY-WYZ-15_(1-7)]|nr:transketolase [Myxococcales bacterium]MAT24267.1 transketolase [Sandaracinus sp.]HJK89308.1 transketolase [Polyangiaceae bacterium LLY-WYZ-15_(1-7)]MBJ74224.1 transketolase [Sandaracinus sp.]HJL04237.1 transketolase [Polyangiaceae bacterium LLY-WYZ-15_(1-7)]